MLLWSKFNLSVELITILLLNHCVRYICVCLLTLVSEGGGSRWRGNRGSRCRDGTLANRLLHDTPPLHLVHHVFYIETAGEKEEDDGWMRKDERHRKVKIRWA